MSIAWLHKGIVNMITNLNPYGQQAWHVVAYHYEIAESSRRRPRPDACSHVVMYLIELIDIALSVRDYPAAMIFVDMVFEYRERSMSHG